MKKVSFIHAADLHLDSPMQGLKYLPGHIFERLQESTFTAFTRVVDTALKLKVDFVILAGDLFDGEDRSLRAQSRFRKQMERLAVQQIPVYIVHGNHDHLGGKWPHLQLPENVHIFTEKVEVKSFTNSVNTTVHLYGFSYPRRHVLERKVDEYTKKEGSDFHIGILHGHFEGNSEHGRYAPFSISDLVEKHFDYWALGHIHTRIHLAEEPPIIYPGNTQGRNRKEAGVKGCYHITLTEAGSHFEFIPTSDVIWKELEVDASKAASFSEVYSLCRNYMEGVRSEKKGILLHITLRGIDLDGQLRSFLESGELIESLQEEEENEGDFVWPFRLTIEETKRWQRAALVGEADFYKELFSTVDQYKEMDKCLDFLYNHPSARKYVQALSEDEQSQLLQEVEDMLIHLLYKA